MAPLALRLAHAWGGGFVTARGREDADDYVLLLTRPLLILCAEDAAWPRREHSASEEALASGGGLGGLGGLGGPGGGDRAWLEPWVRAWEGRPFSFSAALDPLVALAVVHLAAFEHHCRTAAAAGGSGGGESGGGSGRSAAHSLRVYDPCCGSGTIVAAARALGASVAGSDIRAKFVAGVGANLAHVALSEGVALFEHDATLALPREGEAQGRGLAAQLVVTNPPWARTSAPWTAACPSWRGSSRSTAARPSASSSTATRSPRCAPSRGCSCAGTCASVGSRWWWHAALRGRASATTERL